MADVKINEHSLDWWMAECMRRGNDLVALHSDKFALMAERDRAREALRGILSEAGRASMSYAPDVERAEFLNMLANVRRIAEKALRGEAGKL